MKFTTNSGGSPINAAHVPEIYRDDRRSYSTVANGTAYYGEVEIDCISTGRTDGLGFEIYTTPSGVEFVYQYSPGSAHDFDAGALMPPDTEIIPDHYRLNW